MSTMAAARTRTTSLRPHRGAAAVVAVSLLSAAAFVALRAGVSVPYPTFTGACQRLHDAGILVTAQDWFCRPAPWTAQAAYMAASLLLAVAFVVPCMILAATGRRVAAYLPLLVAPAMSVQGLLIFNGFDGWWGRGSWPRGEFVGVAVSLLVMATPVAAVVVAARGRRAPRPQIPLAVSALSWLLCGIGVASIEWIVRGIFTRHFASLGGTTGATGFVVPAIAMVVFAAILGPDRRWWPWSLAPVALLLSAAPSLALAGGPHGLVDWSRFGLVVPLFAAGLVGSAWRPFAERVTRRIRSTEPAPEPAPSAPGTAASPSSPVEPDRVRPVVILSAVAVALLVVSLVMFRADPLPAQVGVALPTFLGERTLAQDVRTRMNLRLAITAMDAYREAHGTYRGFDGEMGNESQSLLAWTDGVPAQEMPHTLPSLQVGVLSATGDVARVVAFSASGNAFCLQRTPGGLTYGAGDGGRGSMFGTVRDAIAGCAATAWSPAQVRMFSVATMCRDADPSGYLICRMVQVIVTQTLQQTKPD
ncbi:MAG: hypothetical protein M3P43_05715 [Actinomycetota bacterium]|nr:hypothetical protein [Actinomycetota bacterium]